MKHAESTHTHTRFSTAQLTTKTWPDFEKLFASNGGVWGGCWCMFFHKPGNFDARAYSENREDKHTLVTEGKAHGTIVYCGRDPVGWCQFGPKDELPRIEGKRGYRPTCDDPWRITCLFIASGHRRSGLAELAVQGSVRAMRKLKAKVIEAYPVEGMRSATLLWSGTPGLFEGAGFTRIGPLGKRSWIYALDFRRP